jgi:hypothetical protein
MKTGTLPYFGAKYPMPAQSRAASPDSLAGTKLAVLVLPTTSWLKIPKDLWRSCEKLREYSIKGFTLDNERLKQAGGGK